MMRTMQGSCAVQCPACPHLGKNLPANWVDKGNKRQLIVSYNFFMTFMTLFHSFLYTLSLSMGVNFQLKLKERNIKDKKRLGRGLSYYVNETLYGEMVSKSMHVIEVFDSTVICD